MKKNCEMLQEKSNEELIKKTRPSDYNIPIQ